MSNSPIVRDVLDNGLRLLTERMTQVRSISIGVWLTRGSRHETAERGGIAHFVEHMLFKGTATPVGRGHRAGDRLDRRPARRVHGEGIRELLHQGARRAPAARRSTSSSDIVLQPGVQRRGRRAREEGRPRRDQDGRGHAGRSRARALHAGLLGGPPARPADSRHARRRSSRSPADSLRDYFRSAYAAPNLIVSAVGNLEHARVRELVEQKFGVAAGVGRAARGARRRRSCRKILIRNKELEQSHLCLGASSYPQNHDDRYVELRAEHAARRLDELAPVPERPREARPGVRRVQRPERLPRRRLVHHLRRLRERGRRAR